MTCMMALFLLAVLCVHVHATFDTPPNSNGHNISRSTSPPTGMATQLPLQSTLPDPSTLGTTSSAIAKPGGIPTYTPTKLPSTIPHYSSNPTVYPSFTPTVPPLGFPATRSPTMTPAYWLPSHAPTTLNSTIIASEAVCGSNVNSVFSPRRDVWYYFSANASGMYIFKTCDVNHITNISIHLYGRNEINGDVKLPISGGLRQCADGLNQMLWHQLARGEQLWIKISGIDGTAIDFYNLTIICPFHSSSVSTSIPRSSEQNVITTSATSTRTASSAITSSPTSAPHHLGFRNESDLDANIPHWALTCVDQVKECSEEQVDDINYIIYGQQGLTNRVSPLSSNAAVSESIIDTWNTAYHPSDGRRCRHDGSCVSDCILPCNAPYRGNPTTLTCNTSTGRYSGHVRACFRFTNYSDILVVPHCQCNSHSTLYQPGNILAETRFYCDDMTALQTNRKCTALNHDGRCPSQSCLTPCRSMMANSIDISPSPNYWNFTMSESTSSLPATHGPNRYLRLLRGRIVKGLVIDVQNHWCLSLDPMQDFRLDFLPHRRIARSISKTLTMIFWGFGENHPTSISTQMNVNPELTLPPAPYRQIFLPFNKTLRSSPYLYTESYEKLPQRCTESSTHQVNFYHYGMGVSDTCERSPFHIDHCITTGTAPYRIMASNLPPGITLDPLTGRLEGTATQSGNFTVYFTVYDLNFHIKRFPPFVISVLDTGTVWYLNNDNQKCLSPIISKGSQLLRFRYQHSINGTSYYAKKNQLTLFFCNISACTSSASEQPCVHKIDFRQEDESERDLSTVVDFGGTGRATATLVLVDLFGTFTRLCDYHLDMEADLSLVEGSESNSSLILLVVLGVVVVLAVALLVAYIQKQRSKIHRLQHHQFSFPSTDEWEYDRNKLLFDGELGEGAFGVVSKALAENIKDSRGFLTVAVKECRKTIETIEKMNFIHECNLMKRLHHENIIQLLGVCLQEEPLLLITEFMSNGDLKRFVKSGKATSVRMLLNFGRDIAKGLCYLHDSHRFVHRDLASRNCLLNHNLEVKIGDFGMSRSTLYKDYYRLTRDAKLPVRWMAPESLDEGNFSSASDVWSLGIVIWEILSGCIIPYAGMDNHEVLKAIKIGFRLNRPVCCPTRVYAICMECWDSVPGRRPTATVVANRLDEAGREPAALQSFTSQGKMVEPSNDLSDCPHFSWNPAVFFRRERIDSVSSNYSTVAYADTAFKRSSDNIFGATDVSPNEHILFRTEYEETELQTLSKSTPSLESMVVPHCWTSTA